MPSTIGNRTACRIQVWSGGRGWFGGTPPTRVLLESAMIYLCNDILCRYASSEIGLIAEATAREVLAKPGLIGRIVPGIRVEICDSSGNPCPPGKFGMIKVQVTHDSRDGRGSPLIELGDVGWLDSENRLYGVRRSANAHELEHGSSSIDEVEHMIRLEWDFIDAAAVSLNDRSAGRPATIGFAIVGDHKLTPEMLTTLVRARGHDYAFKLVKLPVIPRGANGKVNRQQLKALIREVADRRSGS